MQRSSNRIRTLLRKHEWWIRFQEVNREGWANAFARHRVQDAILSTPPLQTAREGDVEVRVLTWRRDWKNLIWALKSFYHFAGTKYPLYIHDGGLNQRGAAVLRSHFPYAYFPLKQEIGEQVERMLSARGLVRCLDYRRRNPTTLKLFDFFAASRARTVISVDSDIVFFSHPGELLNGYPGKNLYNRDSRYWYSMSLEEIEARFGVRVPPYINSGLARIQRSSINFDAIENWLSEPKLFEDVWVTEQTLHALCSSQYGVELLSPAYMVSTQPGIIENAVCKHYPGYFRPLLYCEGMRKLAGQGFLQELMKAAAQA